MMMMIRETHHANHPTIQVPSSWDFMDDPTANIQSPFSFSDSSSMDALLALQRYLPSNMNDVLSDDSDDVDVPVDAFSCDHFRMFDFKVRRCSRARSHDWTECPYAHPGEKARRRDPRKFHYSGTACPDFRKGQCKKGDSCEFAHGVFECWLHPSRYRTQPCKDGTHCRRRVCFFAHTPDQLRVLPQSSHSETGELYDGYGSGSSRRSGTIGSSPTPSPPSDSPPMSPNGYMSLNSVNGLTDAMRGLQISKARMCMSPSSWGCQMGPGVGSPRSPSTARTGFTSLPSTPTRNMGLSPARYGLGVFDLWEKASEEEPVMERVESGRDLRARIYAKLSRENSLDY